VAVTVKEIEVARPRVDPDLAVLRRREIHRHARNQLTTRPTGMHQDLGTKRLDQRDVECVGFRLRLRRDRQNIFPAIDSSQRCRRARSYFGAKRVRDSHAE
jgi:hypothetical protein